MQLVAVARTDTAWQAAIVITSGGPSAGAITLSETITLLDGPHNGLAEGIANGLYALWLGSGISRARVDGLEEVTTRVLEFLQARIAPGNPACPYRVALNEAIDHANLPDADRASIDIDAPVATWPCLNALVRGLVRAYSDVLDIRIPGEAEDYLLWDGVDAAATFAATTTGPDCEHMAIAVLAAEGLLHDIASGNWDGLVETADNAVGANAMPVTKVYVTAEHFRDQPNARSRLIKFHGCAVLARYDGSTYRKYLVARKSQIVMWPRDAIHAVLRAQLVQVAVTRPTLMVGFSLSDTNITDVFVDAQTQMSWEWPRTTPAFVFSEETLTNGQRTILKAVYGRHYEMHGAEVEAHAHIRAFAKPLLTGLMLYALTAKLAVLSANADIPKIPLTSRGALREGLESIRDAIAASCTDRWEEFVRAFVVDYCHAMTLFQDGDVGGRPSRYRPISSGPASEVMTDAHISTSGLPQLAVGLGLLGLGAKRAVWTLLASDPAAGDLRAPARVHTATRVHRIYFAANAHAATRLIVSGAVADEDDDVVVVHSTSVPSRTPRSPTGAHGRTGRLQLREVGMNPLLSGAAEVDEMFVQFRTEASL